MGLIALPQRFTSQPQYSPQLLQAYQNAAVVSLFNVGAGKDLIQGNHLLPVSAAPLPVVRPHGKALYFDGSSTQLASIRPIACAPQFTVMAWVRPAVLNSGYTRILETHFSTQFYLGSNTGTKYAWIVNNSGLEGCIGGQQVVSQRDLLTGTFDGATARLYVNGVQVGSIAATTPTTPNYLSVGYSNAGGVFAWNGDIDTVGVFNRAFPADEVLKIYRNTWAQMLVAPPRIIRRLPISSVTLIGAASTQVNPSATGAVTQTHVLAGAASTEVNASSTGAISQAHVLVGAASTEVNAASTGAISQAHVLAGAAATEVNASSTGAISQAHVLAGAASTEVNAASTGAISQAHALAGAASTQGNASSNASITQECNLNAAGCAQSNASSVAAITQAHALSVAPSAQINASASGEIVLGVAVMLAGAASTQSNVAQSATITQNHTLICAPSVQDNVASASAIVQAHMLAAAACDQVNASQNATISVPGAILPVAAPAGGGPQLRNQRTSRPVIWYRRPRQ